MFGERSENTVRMKWTGCAGAMPQREQFIKTVVIEKFSLTEKEVLGIQRKGREEYVDLAFWTAWLFQEFLRRSKTVEDLGHYEVESLERRNHRVVVINMYDINLPDESVTRFLERYSRVVSGGCKKTPSGFGMGSASMRCS